MPAARPRRALVTNENDENNSTRLTRAKAAALNVDELAMPAKPLQSRKGATANNSNMTAAGEPRKRAALGDLSNVSKLTTVQDGKKTMAAGKQGLVSKAAQPTGVTKISAAKPATTRALGAKDANKKVEQKRSGAGAIGPTKRKLSATTTEQETKTEGSLRKKTHLAQTTIKTTIQEEEEVVEVKPVAPQPPRTRPVVQVTPEPAPQQVPHFDDIDSLDPPPGVRDMDLDDLDDPLMVAEYAKEIFQYLRELELKNGPNPDYMGHQDELKWRLRGVLVDWLVEVHNRFHLLPETLYMGVNIIDRFLSEKVVALDRLQLVGITAMFIASKYEEIFAPHASSFVNVADNGYKESEIFAAERGILNVLNWDVSYANPMNFLRRISKADHYDIHTRTVAKYLTEISLLDHRFLEYQGSHVAAAAMYLAREILEREGGWDATFEYYSGYTEQEIFPVVQLMVDYLARPVVHEAFYKKYAHKKFLKTSFVARSWCKEHAASFGVVDPDLKLYDIAG